MSISGSLSLPLPNTESAYLYDVVFQGPQHVCGEDPVCSSFEGLPLSSSEREYTQEVPVWGRPVSFLLEMLLGHGKVLPLELVPPSQSQLGFQPSCKS